MINILAYDHDLVLLHACYRELLTSFARLHIM